MNTNPNQPPTAYRRLLRFAEGLSLIGFLGGGLWLIAGAGMYGSPVSGAHKVNALTGLPNYWEFWIFWVVAVGPMGLLPCTLLENFFPRVGAIAMMAAAIFVAEAGILSGRGSDGWGYRCDDALIVMGCIAAPIMVLGVALLALRTPRFRWRSAKTTLLVLAVFLCGHLVVEKIFWDAHSRKIQGR